MAANTQTRSTTRGAHRERAPAQLFALVAGVTLIVVGLIGFVAAASFDTGSGVDGGSLLGFEFNGIHNLSTSPAGCCCSPAPDARAAPEPFVSFSGSPTPS